MLHFRMDMPLYLMAMYGSVMIAVVLLLRFFLRNRLPKFVFPLLWSLILIRLLVPFSLSSPLSAPVPQWQMQLSEASAVYVVEDQPTARENTSPGTAETTSDGMNYSYAERSGSLLTDDRSLLIVIFGLGVLTTAGILLSQKLQYSRKLKNSLLVEHNQTINAHLRDMGMGHILVCTNDEIASPLVCGIVNPRIYLPGSMDFRQSQLLRHILAHETMHIKRKDNWLKMVMLIALCFHWYNPLVWIMSKYLASDLEAACDAAVLRQVGDDERQSYAVSLLSMAITGNRTTLLFSAFSKTEVERRIKNVLSYKNATALMLALSMLLIFFSTVAFATGGQAPFSSYLSSYCASTSSQWAVKAELARDISLGENAGQRADNVIFDVLERDTSNDPEVIARQVKAALSKEFGVEKGAFQIGVDLCLTEEEVSKEYKNQGITKGQDGFYLYKGEAVRVYQDKMLGSVHTREAGMVDLSVNRDRFGRIISLTVLKEGDAEFDRYTRKMEISHRSNTSSTDQATASNQSTTIEEDGQGFFR
ncbi:hypothetical protein FRZ06_04495 [Anoxybacterium hadale]|uniref:Uncharacterized protein n=1 Tax=Anoxybacterium hadale TaxID=3408580 RepID=A0ACD1A8B0_9FIRM|nr:hypothetical protein FRZ06_04495 [Clostridiales bacterium]